MNFKEFIAAHPKRCRLAICIFLFFVALLRYWMSYDPAAFVPRHPESFRLAYNLYEHRQFANPFLAADTGPSAHLAPAFPGLLAGLMLIFGVNSIGLYAIQLVSVLILALQISLYPVFSRALGMGTLSGAIGASVWILAKPASFFAWEAFYASFALMGACCLFRQHLDMQEPAAATWVLGSTMGLMSLMVPTVLPILGTWLAWDIGRRKAAFFKTFFLPLVLLPTLITIPWTIRNYRVFHRFILVRDDLGLELAVSNNDCAQFSMQQNFNGCFQQSHPNRSANEARKVLELGEPDYNKLRLREVLDWIKAHRRRFVRLSVYRFIAWWMPTESGTLQFEEYTGKDRRLERSIIYLMTLLSVAGLAILFRSDFKSAVLCVSCLAIFPLIYYFVQFQDRYRDPIMWLTFLLGALPISTFVRRVYLQPGAVSSDNASST
jgi:hypothetical protein